MNNTKHRNEIKVLPQGVADKIAAGEVAERPSSVVKELVENAIDAGGTKISVEIKRGGIKLIRVTDNGCGIPADQVKSAFLRHATSKLRDAEDLYSISTMGFRGEALSSICAVARVEVITRTEEEETGVHYIVDHGICGEADEIACARGTIIAAEDLFANIPARMKFLKKDSTEAGYITDLMTRLSLANPDIAFEYISDGKEMFRTSGDGSLENTILRVYGLKFAKAVLPIEYSESGVRVTGAVGKPELSFGNRTRQTVIVNGRYIKNHVISKVAEEAMRNTYMVGRFPFFVINIELPPQQVDVNVHPAKTEVKFANEKELYDIVYHAVSNALYGGSRTAAADIKNIRSDIKPDTKITKDRSIDFSNQRIDHGERPAAIFGQGHNSGGNMYLSDSAKKYPPLFLGDINGGKKVGAEVVRDYLNYTTPQVKPDSGNVSDIFSSDIKNPEDKSQSESQNENDFETFSFLDTDDTDDTVDTDKENSGGTHSPLNNCRIAGQVFNTYIIIESGNSVYMIDQHAAHERYGFEELKAEYMKNERLSQALLIPVTFNMSESEYNALMDNLDVFGRFGFEIEEFGRNTIIINATPITGSDEEIKSLLYEILAAVQDNIKHPIADFEENALDMISCKKAIKGGDRLTPPEMSKVVEIVKELAAKGITTCPHGRPITAEITKRELEKMFKRIV